VAIESVLFQTFQDFELIVVDDASNDDTKEVVSSFHCDRIRFIQHRVNKGGGASRNTGIKNACGEYIAFLDDDDIWLPRKLELQVDLLDKCPAAVGGVYTGYERVDRASGEIVSRMVPTKEGKLFEALLINNWIGSTSSVLLRKTCFQRVGLFDGDLPSHQDYDMWLRISKEFEFRYIRQPLLIYYIHENKISNNPELRTQGLEIMIGKLGTKSFILRKNYCYRYIRIGMLFCFQGQTRKGRRAFYQAIRMCPYGLRSYLMLILSFFGGDVFRKIIEMRRSVMFRRARQVA
jgi:glycosyltransferase involved in cell wall biosynthesis